MYFRNVKKYKELFDDVKLISARGTRGTSSKLIINKIRFKVTPKFSTIITPFKIIIDKFYLINHKL